MKPTTIRKSVNGIFLSLGVIIIFLFLTACTPGNEKFTENSPSGFLMGLWHGFIALFTFIISLFNDNVTIYEISNTGKLYNLGFLLGIIIFFGGGSKTTCKSKGKRRETA
ncbi:MAG: hypothetical protein RQ866_02285 [Bacteroidales bacterium]|nr:hypothetical protein [Bacteroidales bacterium]